MSKEKRFFQVIISSDNAKEILKIQKSLSNVTDTSKEDIINMIILYDVAPELLLKKYRKFFDRYFHGRRHTLEQILNQFYKTAIEVDSLV